MTPALARPSNKKQKWPAPAVPPAPGTFDQLGWSPEGEVFFVYGAAVGAGAGPTGAGAFSLQAVGDLDADGTQSNFAYIHPGVANVAGLPGPLNGICVGGGTYDAATNAQDLLNTVGPCTANDGASIF